MTPYSRPALLLALRRDLVRLTRASERACRADVVIEKIGGLTNGR
jgi:hypothetical protein